MKEECAKLKGEGGEVGFCFEDGGGEMGKKLTQGGKWQKLKGYLVKNIWREKEAEDRRWKRQKEKWKVRLLFFTRTQKGSMCLSVRFYLD